MDVVAALIYGQQSIENVYRYTISVCFFCHIRQYIQQNKIYIERDDPANQVFSDLIRRKKPATQKAISHIYIHAL